MTQKQDKLKIAALADTHVKETSQGSYKELFASISNTADVLVLCGDLTDLGLVKEAEILADELSECRIPIVAVLGNHDFESELESEIRRILIERKIYVLEGTEYLHEKNGAKYGFTGVKGFGGGFNPLMWGRFGEPEQKAFYDAVQTEVQQLELGLNRIQTGDLAARIVLTHFSPIRGTLAGENPELYPFLGSSRLEEVIDRYEVTAVIHGHSHFGYHKGQTAKGIPVYNVAAPLMQKMHPEKPYLLLEV